MLMVCAKFVISFVIHKKISTFVPKKTTKRMKRLFILLFIALPFATLHAQTGDSLRVVLGARVTDKIMHPFAIKDRKRDKKHARDRKILEEYEQLTRVKTFEELLDEAIRKQAIEDGKEPPTRSGKLK